MKLILLGAPGSGKGTQAAYISGKYDLPHISTGDLFRTNIERKTPLGIKVKDIMDTGNLCPDSLTVEMVEDRIKEQDCANGYLLDGFPRNLYQAQALDEIDAPDVVINIDVDLGVIEHRITGRRSCANCHNSFHTDVIGQTERCPICNGTLIVRKDDNLETVKSRLKVYKEQTEPLIEYYQKQGKLRQIDGNTPVREVFEQILKVLK